MSSQTRRMLNSSRVVVAWLLSIVFATALPVGALAQDGVVGPQTLGMAPTSASRSGQQSQNPITQPLALSPDVPQTRVGVTPGEVAPLSLQDAITFALQNNLDIEQFRQGVRISQFSLNSLRGVYDIVSSADVNYRSQTIPVANLFQGGGQTASLTSRTTTWNFITNQFIEKTGAFWQVEFDNNRINTSSTAATLSTQFSPILALSLTQPLLRNFKIDQNRRSILLAKKSLDLSDSQFRQRVIEIINQVQLAYWDLVFAIRNEQISRESVELTRTQLENNQKMVEAGTLPPIDLRSTEAALESRKGDVIVALQGVTTAENVLKALLIKDPTDKLWNAAIQPSDEPQFGTQAFSLDEATRLALKNRPELDQMRLQSEQKDIDIKYYQNQLKPQIDLFALYTNNGLAGTPSGTGTSGGFDPLTQGLIDNLNLSLTNQGLAPFNPTPPPPTSVGDTVPDRFKGGYGQALRNLFGQDFKTYQIGVRLSFPWGNHTAKGNLGRSLAESRQLDARQRQLVQTVQIDVRNALQAVEAARLRFEAAQAGRTAAAAQLKGEQEKFRAGLSTTFFVLQRQTDLSVAQGTEVRALTDYNKALADLQRVTGMTLISNNLQVSSGNEPNK